MYRMHTFVGNIVL